MVYLCNPLLRGRLFIEGFHFHLSFPRLRVWVAVAGMAGKENENKFCKSGKGFYLCSPKRKPALRARPARGGRASGKGRTAAVQGVGPPARHSGRSVSGGTEVLQRY